MSALRNLTFVTTVAALDTLPPPYGREIAFVGRSNAGKSSAINALAQRKRVAFTSKTPGRTQHINFFSVADDKYLIDLPGYGFAAVPASEREKWNELIGGYLQTRESLCGVILIMDIRHPMKALDLQLIDWLAPTGIPVHILLSKADKLGKQQQAATLRDVETELSKLPIVGSAQLFSSTHKIGIVEAEGKVAEWLQLPAENAGKKKSPG